MGEWRSEYKDFSRGMCSDCYKDPLPHSPLSTGK